jgi:cardiolipin synthase
MVLASGAASHIRLLPSAARAWTQCLAAYAGARRRVHLEAYAFAHDHIGRRFVAELTAAARRGVRVEIVIDAWGSIGAAGAVVSSLRAGGCRARVYNRLHLGGLLRLGRNHRKLLIVDDQLAFVGGINIGDRFAGWADVAVEIAGAPALALSRRLDGEHEVEQHGATRIHLSRLGGGRRLFRRYLKAFSAARERLVVAHSYFLPGPRLIHRLVAAAHRGVEVVLLLPGRSDVPLARVAMAALYAPLVRAGVRIYEWQPSVLHAKLAVIDRRTLLVGSFNLDPYSLANLEALVISDDRPAARAGDAWVSARVAQARPVRDGEGSRVGRIAGALLLWLVRALARLMRAAAARQS